MIRQPPRLFIRFVRKMFNNLDMEEIEGDLAEDFSKNVARYGFRMAQLKYCLNALVLISTYLKRSRKLKRQQPMKTNIAFYLKYGIRSILTHKFYHGLNIASLTLGFSCFVLIYLFVINQSQKNSFLVERDRIVRLGTITQEKERTNVSVALPVVLKKDFPEIESFARFGHGQVEVSQPGDDNVFSEYRITADPDFVDIFQLELLLGKNIEPGSKDLLISEKIAHKFWSDISEAIGKELNFIAYGRESKLTVVGVLKNTPINSSYSVDLLSGTSFGEQELDLSSRVSTAYPVFFKVQSGTDLEALASKIPEHLKKYTDNEMFLSPEYIFRTIDQIRHDPKISNGFIQALDGQALLIFQIVGLVILILAVANYVNISAALTLKRIQEAGIRRVMGATRKSIIWQQLTESMIVGIISVILSSIVLAAMIQSVQDFIGLDLTFEEGQMTGISILGLGFLLTIVFLGSIYPALLLSRFKYNDFVKGKLMHSPSSKWIRTLLLIVQFSIATFLIVGTFTFLKQLDFINDSHNKDLMTDVLIVNGELGEKSEIIRERLKALPEVNKLSISTLVPGPGVKAAVNIGTRDFKETFTVFLIDEYFMDILKINITAGVDFYQDERGRPHHILINQTMAKTVKEGSPLNQEYDTYGSVKSKVIGIVKDFPVRTLKDKVLPTAYFPAKHSGFRTKPNKIILDLKTADMTASIKKVESIWNELFPESPFDIEFMDDRISSIYETELKMGKLFSGLTGIAILIACLGIFGLLSYMVQIKTKEIGIRKVLGANFSTVANLLTKQVWSVLVLSGLIAFPLSFYFLQNWLDSFVYRTTVTIDLYIITLLSFVVIIALTVFWQVRKATALNPTEVLRNE